MPFPEGYFATLLLPGSAVGAAVTEADAREEGRPRKKKGATVEILQILFLGIDMTLSMRAGLASTALGRDAALLPDTTPPGKMNASA